MNEQEFRDLCHSLAAALQVPEPESLDETGEFLVNGYRVGLFLDQESERIDCYLDLGFIDEGRRPEVFGRLLELNLEVDGLHGEALGFDRETGHLLLRSGIRTESGCEPQFLGQLLMAYAEFAAGVKETLLDVTDRSAGRVITGLA